jgi:hypothetical protein
MIVVEIFEHSAARTPGRGLPFAQRGEPVERAGATWRRANAGHISLGQLKPPPTVASLDTSCPAVKSP